MGSIKQYIENEYKFSSLTNKIIGHAIASGDTISPSSPLISLTPQLRDEIMKLGHVDSDNLKTELEKLGWKLFYGSIGQCCLSGIF
jgi:hypothetical protein